MAVLVPEALVKQWRDELIHKFRFAEQFDGRWTVGAYGRPGLRPAVDDCRRRGAPAHAAPAAPDAGAYAAVRAAAERSRGVLLLSATPLLERPDSLQRLLHLLAPAGRPLGRLEDFERSLDGRDEIARHVAVLDPLLPPVILRQALDVLLRLLGDDPFVVAAIQRTRGALDDEATLAQEIRRLRLHISEVHRVHRRMVRSRRGTGLAADFPVLGRRPPTVLRVVDHQAVVQACSVWIGDVLATHEQRPLAPETLWVATRVAQAASQPGDSIGAHRIGGDERRSTRPRSATGPWHCSKTP